MVQLIKKGGLRERANRSRRYHVSEKSSTTSHPNRHKEQRLADQQQEKKPTPPAVDTLK